MEKFGAKKAGSDKKRRTSQKGRAKKQAPSQLITVSDLQSRLGRALPRFAAIGLNSDQVQQVFDIINELLSVE
jgi:hypothetical protein